MESSINEGREKSAPIGFVMGFIVLFLAPSSFVGVFYGVLTKQPSWTIVSVVAFVFCIWAMFAKKSPARPFLEHLRDDDGDSTTAENDVKKD